MNHNRIGNPLGTWSFGGRSQKAWLMVRKCSFGVQGLNSLPPTNYTFDGLLPVLFGVNLITLCSRLFCFFVGTTNRLQSFTSFVSSAFWKWKRVVTWRIWWVAKITTSLRLTNRKKHLDISYFIAEERQVTAKSSDVLVFQTRFNSFAFLFQSGLFSRILGSWEPVSAFQK